MDSSRITKGWMMMNKTAKMALQTVFAFGLGLLAVMVVKNMIQQQYNFKIFYHLVNNTNS